MRGPGKTEMEEYVSDQKNKQYAEEAEKSSAAEEMDAGEDLAATAEKGREGGGQQKAAEEAEGSDLEMELVEARKEAKEHYEKLLRLAAEFENYKKRMEREKQNILKFAEENVIKELLPTIDNLERALDQGSKSKDMQAMVEGVEMTRKALLTSLEKFGLQQINCEGQPFDPNFHEAMCMEANREVPANHVIQEFQKGYMYKDRLIRAAKVIVSGGDNKQ